MNGPLYDPLESLPAARKKLIAAFLGHGMERADAEELLADYEAELAEQLRDEVDEMAADPAAFPKAFREGMHFAANLLDPHDGWGVPPERGGRG
ncbi:hypothetical protein [Streptomyces sp. F-1]|uniref:hypothetical protein n=1 Tax=Streptomyces sp. F-1 TaxID=463642 RepID=UPI00085CA45D|nr:hypothetical protein [Streptomyces sp. F-1]SFY52067.1 hypothetical protein STEPF1_05336 [Streptomyces sp. F-1]